MDNNGLVAKEVGGSWSSGEVVIGVGGLEGLSCDVAMLPCKVTGLASLRSRVLAGVKLSALSRVKVSHSSSAVAIGGNSKLVDMIDWEDVQQLGWLKSLQSLTKRTVVSHGGESSEVDIESNASSASARRRKHRSSDDGAGGAVKVGRRQDSLVCSLWVIRLDSGVSTRAWHCELEIQWSPYCNIPV